MENDEGKDFFFPDGHRFTAGRLVFSLRGMAENLHCVDRLHGPPGAPLPGRPGGRSKLFLWLALLRADEATMKSANSPVKTLTVIYRAIPVLPPLKKNPP